MGYLGRSDHVEAFPSRGTAEGEASPPAVFQLLRLPRLAVQPSGGWVIASLTPDHGGVHHDLAAELEKVLGEAHRWLLAM
jgi:hypothetical protein